MAGRRRFRALSLRFRTAEDCNMRSLLLLVFVLAVAGCRSQRSIVGTWSTRADVGGGTMIFRSDQSFRAVRETPLATMILDGSYEYKGDTLRLQVVKWNIVRGPTLDSKQSTEM